ncbi:MAG: type II secretion system GspH family protein [Lentisphaeraceae bacterium]|nr:type II secretion system GspH family protein [Lentisphaeraceae bacterium]
MKKGFTLIELLVVVSIIGILSSILLPSLSKARNKAKQAFCLNNMKQSYTCILIYADENNEYGPKTDQKSNGQLWYNKLIPAYLPENDVVNGASPSLSCPSGLDLTLSWHSTVAINPHVSNHESDWQAVRVTQGTSKSMVLMDAYKNWSVVFPTYMESSKLVEDSDQHNMARHSGSANIAKGDGSARAHKGLSMTQYNSYTDIFWDFN